MTDGSKVRIVHKPAQATRPGIEYAWTTASPRGVPGEATEGERPENDGGELGTCERVLLDGAECSAQRAVQLDAANPIKQWQECDKELQQIREWSTQKSGGPRGQPVDEKPLVTARSDSRA
ncbi:hypothetical protein TPS_04526 [Trichinella pseudospiralis]